MIAARSIALGKQICLIALAAALGVTPSFVVPANASDVPGEVIEAIPQARLSRSGKVTVLEVGNDVFVGDIVATGRTGEAQLIFPDDTKIVVGPNSQLKVNRALFRNSTSYRRLTVSALKGTFRFLSGNSPSNAYSVRTPTATMGVRGTSFDFAVTGREATDLVVYDGEVNFCGRRSRCVRIPGGCNAVKVNRRADFSQPETFGERRTILNQLFPYADTQDNLRPTFRVSNALCDDNDQDPSTPIRASSPVQQSIVLPPPVSRSNDSGGSGLNERPQQRSSPNSSSSSAPTRSAPSSQSAPSAPSAPSSAPDPAPSSSPSRRR